MVRRLIRGGHQAVSGISQRMLALTLKRLEADGIVT